MVSIGAEYVRGAEDVWGVVVEAEVVEEDAVVGVIRFEEVFECSCALLGSFFDVVE